MNKLLRTSKVFIKRNSPTILTVLGGAGVIGTAVLAVKATPKAMQLLEQAEKEKGEELTKIETVKVAGPAYIPAAITGVGTLACIFGANVLNKRQQAAMTSAYALLENAYKEYKNKVIELYGEEADKAVREEIAKDHYKESDIEPEDNKLLFYDQFSEQYFNATMEDVVKAEYYVNRQISLVGGAYLNEFYEQLGLPQVDYGNELGWSSGGLMFHAWSQWLDFEHEKFETDDGLEGYIITMSVEPTVDYDYY